MDNPFADPVSKMQSVEFYDSNSGQLSNQGSHEVQTKALDNYNPFEANTNSFKMGAEKTISLPAYSTLQAQMLTTAELERRQKELDTKAAELTRREDEQRRREQSTGISSTEKNWPNLPSFCPCGPCFYQNIDVEIIPEYQKLVKFGYYMWMAYAAVLVLNLLGAFVFFLGTKDPTGGSLFGVAIVVSIICIPSSYACWFRPLYKAFKTNSSVNFFIFFIVFGIQIFVMIIQTIGILNWGTCGWLTALSIVKDYKSVSILIFLIAMLFTGLTVYCVLFFIQVHNIYRNTGNSFSKAKQEFAYGVVTDTDIRNTAMEAGLFSVRQAFKSNQQAPSTISSVTTTTTTTTSNSSNRTP